MGIIVYSVVATLPDRQTLDAYVDWLRGGHLQGVLAGGAMRAQIHRMIEPILQVETRYEFPDRASFDRYEHEFAPALRAEGRERFGSIPGVSFVRSMGERIADIPNANDGGREP